MLQMKVFKMAAVLALLPATALAQRAKPGEVESKTSAGLHYRVAKLFNGVITADDFNGKELDPKLWSVITLPEIKVYVEDGTLRASKEPVQKATDATSRRDSGPSASQHTPRGRRC